MSSEKKISFLTPITDRIKILLFQSLVRWITTFLGFLTLPFIYLSLLLTAIVHKSPYGFFEFLEPQKDKPPIFKYYGDDIEIKNKRITLYGKKIGDPSAKEVIVFLHGFPDFWYSWRKQIDLLKDRYLCIAINQRGYYPSTAPRLWTSYRLDELAEDVKAVIEHTGRTRAIIIGHDWGAIVLYHFLLKYPSYVTKYVALAIPPQYSLQFNVFQFIKSWYMYFFQLPFIPQYYLKSFKADMKYFKSITDSLPIEEQEVYRYFYSQKDVFTGPVNYYRANLPTLFRYFLFGVPDLQQKPFPKGLLIHGDMDKFISVVSFLYAQRVPNLKVVSNLFDNHWAHVRDPAVNKEIDDFLREEEVQVGKEPEKIPLQQITDEKKPSTSDGKLPKIENDPKITLPVDIKPKIPAI